MDPRPPILDQTLLQLAEGFERDGQPAYRARQVWIGLYRRLASSFEDMTELPLALRQRTEPTLEGCLRKPTHARRIVRSIDK